MGVPKFFRYISERYPCLSELVKEYQIPEFDNLYLDMNGIIHMCSHPNDFDPHFRISEEKIFKDIFHYLEILFRMIQPRKLFFMAIDGVAPRAKMNQQRGRRFRSAKEAEVLELRAKAKGEKLPSEARFDSNCITPGTVFMARLHEQLKYFVSLKVSTDKLWQNVKVILSGHETPGEGEHKIMDYIRWMRSQDGYDPNTRHCLYGLDADLIMLGLCTHEPHFSLLREEVKFGKKADGKRCSAPEETRFYLLHLSLMREYLELEFQALKGKLSFPFDLECIIDDWVLMGFLVGNDFIPHLPDVHIANGALPMLYNAYIEVLPTLDGYINEHGTLRLHRFQKLMEKLSAFDINQFKENYADAKYFEGKTGRKMQSADHCNPQNGKPDHSQRKTGNAELDALIKATEEKVMEKYFDDEEGCDAVEESDEDDVDVFGSRVYEDDSDSEMSDLMKSEFHQQKKDYYRNKLEYGKVTQQVLRDQAEGYVRAIQWNLHYYYHGVASWSWFYPHHYAPYVSDICNFKDVELDFKIGMPFRPFEQLLAVLPAASKSLLPLPYQELMVQENSPIVDYYPADFRTDLNGKKQDWEAVVLIPFISESRLLQAMGPCYDRLSQEEQKRNEFGPMWVFTYTKENLGQYAAPEYFTTIPKNHAMARPLWRDDLFLKPENIVSGLAPGVRLDVFFPGFPTFKHLPYTGKLKKGKVQVFDQASRGENMILTLTERDEIRSLNLQEAADEYLGKHVYCGWPRLSEGRVVAVSDGVERYNMLSEERVSVENLQKISAAQWVATAQAIENEYMRRQGVAIGNVDILLYTSHVDGRKYTFAACGKITLEKTYHARPTPYALQTVVKDISVRDPSFVLYKTLAEVFPPRSKCFLLSPPIYGAMGHVRDGGSNLLPGRVKVAMVDHQEPNLESVKHNMHLYTTPYLFGTKAAQQIGISSHVLSRITGTVYLITGNKQAENPSKLNIGLNLKFNKKNEEVPGYTKRDNSVWLYSSKTVEIVKQYVELFPEVFQHISRQSSNDVYDDTEVFPGDECSRKVSALSMWLKTLPCSNVERRTCGSEVLDAGVVNQIDLVIKKFLKSHRKVRTVIMQVKPHTLFKSELRSGNLPPDPTTTYALFDRVINVREDSCVPIGLRGTLFGIHTAEKDVDVMYDILFDEAFPGGMSLGGSRDNSYRVSRAAFINLSHGERSHGARPSTPLLNQMAQDARGASARAATSRAASAFASWKPPPNLSDMIGGGNERRKSSNRDKQGSELSDSLSHGFDFPAPPNVTQTHMAPMQTSPSQQQALWSDLQQMSLKNRGRPSADEQKLKKPGSPIHQKKASISRLPGDSETNALKKALRIEEGSSEKNSLRPQSSSQISANADRKVVGSGAVKSEDQIELGRDVPQGTKQLEDACGRLLSFFQMKGAGVPSYHYFIQPNGPTYAEVTLPDGNVFRGDNATNKEMAAEYAARKALSSIAPTTTKDSNSHTTFQPQQLFEQFHRERFPPPTGPPAISGVSGIRPWGHTANNWQAIPPPPIKSAFPTSQHQSYGNYSQSPQKNYQHPSNQRGRGSSDGNNMLGPLDPNRPQQKTQNQVHNPDQKGSSMEPKSFVPLQAMKQQRNAVKSAALLRHEHEQQKAVSFTSTNRKSPSNNQQTKNVEPQGSDKTVVQDGSGTTPVCNNTSSTQGSRSVSKKRKPRLAINFSVPFGS